MVTQVLDGDEEAAKEVVERGLKGQEAKKKLMETTSMAFEDEAFGVPWFVGELTSSSSLTCSCLGFDTFLTFTFFADIVTNSEGPTARYWGVDHMGQICDFLGLERPGGRGWKALL